MVLRTLFRAKPTTIHLFQNRKFAQSCVKSWLCSQASFGKGVCRCCHGLSAKAGATFTWFKLFESDEQGGDQFASQEITYHAERQIPGSSEVVDFKNLLSCPNQLVCFRAQTPIASRYYYEFKQKFFDIHRVRSNNWKENSRLFPDFSKPQDPLFPNPTNSSHCQHPKSPTMFNRPPQFYFFNITSPYLSKKDTVFIFCFVMDLSCQGDQLVHLLPNTLPEKARLIDSAQPSTLQL